MKIVQIRGSNGSGKTTILKQACDICNLKQIKIAINETLTTICVDENKKIVVLGKYDVGCGGVDRFKDYQHIIDTLIYVVCKIQPQLILFEGVIASQSLKFCCKIKDIFKRYNCEYYVINLNTDINVSLKRIYQRNGGKQIKEEQVLQKQIQILKSHRKMIEKGFAAKLIDTTHIKIENMWKLIESYLNEI